MAETNAKLQESEAKITAALQSVRDANTELGKAVERSNGDVVLLVGKIGDLDRQIADLKATVDAGGLSDEALTMLDEISTGSRTLKETAEGLDPYKEAPAPTDPADEGTGEDAGPSGGVDVNPITGEDLPVEPLQQRNIRKKK